jgi:hypothetical protein
MRPKWFLSLGYVWHKPCTYLESRLELFPNGPKRAFIWTSSPRSTIHCVQNYFWAYRTFGANCAPIMHRNWHISKRIETRFYMTHVTWEFDRVRPKRFMRLWYVWCKLWIYLAPILTPSPNGPKQDSTWPMSPRSSIGCVQSDFQAYGTFGAKRCTNLEPRHLGVPSSVSKIISEAMVHLAQTVRLSCTETNTVSKPTETSFHLTLVT